MILMKNLIRTRFAPSPTGTLHIGGLRTALYAYLFAKKEQGVFVLRIEDTDLDRTVAGAADMIYRTLKDAGLSYDEGPDVGGPYGPYVQSQRKAIYERHARTLVERGGAYYCFCGKERLAALPAQGDGAQRYDKRCLSLPPAEVQKRLAAGEPHVIRQNIPAEGVSRYHDMVYGEIVIDNKELEDNVLLKSDGMPTYNFANVVDDHLMGITHVLRGSEYLSSTPKYNHLYTSFGWELPVYIHMPPIMRDAQNKLSKRHGDASYEDFIAKGFLKEAVVNYIALLGWSPKENREKFTLAELSALFSIAGLSKSPAIFDEAKLRWLNGQYIKELPPDQFYRRALPFIEGSKAAAAGFDPHALARLVQPRIETLSDIDNMTRYLVEFGAFDPKLYEHQKMKTDIPLARAVLPAVLKALEKIPANRWDEATLHDTLLAVVASLSLKNGQILWPTRIALTARETTPGGATENAALLGKAESVRRLKYSIERLKG